MVNSSAPERFGIRTVWSRMMKDVGVVETMSLVPRVAAELMKISRTLTLKSRPPHKSRSQWIGPTQGRILAFLRSRSRSQITLSALTEVTALSSATISEAVRALEERGLVRKARSRDDARVVYLSLSPAGRRKAEQAATGNNHLNAAIRRLTQREQELILHALKKIQQAVDLRVKKQ
jgi:DNA-binding MarR family transcriptional regulator